MINDALFVNWEGDLGVSRWGVGCMVTECQPRRAKWNDRTPSFETPYMRKQEISRFKGALWFHEIDNTISRRWLARLTKATHEAHRAWG